MMAIHHNPGGHWRNMDLDLLVRVRKSSLIFGLVLAVVFATYFGLAGGIAWAAGIMWSLANLHFITTLVKNVITTDERSAKRIVLTVVVKFPVLYAIGFVLLAVLRLPVQWLVAGFTWPFVVLVLKGFGRAWLKLDEQAVDAPRNP